MMSKSDKLLQKLTNRPKDFTFAELETLMRNFGYELSNTGKTSGSSVKFVNREANNDTLFLHKPHPSPILKPYQIKYIVNKLKQGGHIDG